MSVFSFHAMDQLFQDYGYGAVFTGVLLESTGLPLPGESLMIAAALYASTTHKLSIVPLVASAALGAILGDQIGYFIGKSLGFRLLARWGQKIGLTEERLELGRYLFRRYGGLVVFLGRFVAILRTFAALLAGANQMAWHTFVVWNALGGICWTSLYGFAAYAIGDAMKRITGPIGIVVGVLGAIVLVAGFIYVKRNERRLIEAARQDIHSSDAGSYHDPQRAPRPPHALQ
jgi:membrane protein DedA with SNARE-associated domain